MERFWVWDCCPCSLVMGHMGHVPVADVWGSFLPHCNEPRASAGQASPFFAASGFPEWRPSPGVPPHWAWSLGNNTYFRSQNQQASCRIGWLWRFPLPFTDHWCMSYAAWAKIYSSAAPLLKQFNWLLNAFVSSVLGQNETKLVSVIRVYSHEMSGSRRQCPTWDIHMGTKRSFCNQRTLEWYRAPEIWKHNGDSQSSTAKPLPYLRQQPAYQSAQSKKPHKRTGSEQLEEKWTLSFTQGEGKLI